MHPTETHDRFIELRVQGWSLERIAADLHVAKRTLIEWQRQYQRDIAGLRALELEALQDRILASHEQELTRLAARLNHVESILDQRKLECLSTEFLCCLAGALRSQIRRQRILPALPPPAANPNPEP